MLGELRSSEIERILRTRQIGRLGVYGDGRVYVFPVNFGYDGTGIFIHSPEGL